MLQLIGYDLQQPDKDYRALEQAMRSCGDGIHLSRGPWLLGTDATPNQILNHLIRDLGGHGGCNDRLLVLQVSMGQLGTGRRAVPPTAATPQGPRPETAGQPRVLAVAYHLHHAKPQHRLQLYDTLAAFGNVCRPLTALWLVATDLSAQEAHLQIEKGAGLTTEDELLVVEVVRRRNGARLNLEPEITTWLEEHALISQEQLIPEPVDLPPQVVHA